MQIHYTERITWHQLPGALRARIESCLGSRVVRAQSQASGFSPGSADRLLTADGQRVFAKAVHPFLSASAAALHAREAKIAARMPAPLPVPQFLGHISWEGWEALVFAEGPGSSPQLPWTADELQRVLDTLVQLARQAPASLVEQLPPLQEELREDAAGFARIMQDGWQPADTWVAQHLEDLQELAMGRPRGAGRRPAGAFRSALGQHPAGRGRGSAAG